MFELVINGTSYQFNFGIGFVKDINKTVQKPADGIPGVKEDIGLAYNIGQILSGDVIALIDALDLANKGKTPRVAKSDLEAYVEDPDTDIDKLFEDVIDFFMTANATKKIATAMRKAMGLLEETE